MLHRHKKAASAKKMDARKTEKRKTNIPKREKILSAFAGHWDSGKAMQDLRWRDQILDGEILGVKGILRHPAKKRPASLGGMERPYRTMVL